MFNKNLSRIQRRSLQLFSSSIIFTAVATLLTRDFFKQHSNTGPLAWLVAILPAIPFLGTILISTRYLHREPDEFIRAVVLKSILSGSLWTVCFTIVYACLENFCGLRGAPVMIYADIFLVASMIAVRVNVWRSR